MSVKVYPDIEIINSFKVPLTNGEQGLLKGLTGLFETPQYKDRFMEIYVQPNLFLGKPDFVIIEKNSSVWIIEVKDYLKNAYTISSHNNKDLWKLSNNLNVNINSPFEQVARYKKDLMQYANPSLEQLASTFRQDDLKRNQYNRLIRTGVYFSYFNKEDISGLKRNLLVEERKNEYQFSYLFSSSDFEEASSREIFDKFFEKMYSKSYQLSNEQYIDIQAILDPGDSGKNFPLPDFVEQSYIQASRSLPARRKIRGEAGSGKTTVLAKRVVDCANRLPQGTKILIVTYNITICNYIRDKIVAESGKTLNELGVMISHYHQLFKWEKQDNIWKEAGKNYDETYDAIFIDEGQDFKEKWYRLLIEQYLKNPDIKTNEYVIFADEVQNIYSRNQVETLVDGRKTALPVTPVPGDWRTLTSNFRVENNHILSVANYFEKMILNRDTENKLILQQLNLENELSENLVKYKEIENLQEIVEYIRLHVKHLISDLGAKINDIVVLSGSIKLLRNIEFELRNNTRSNNVFSNTATTFVPKDKIEKGANPKGDKSYKMRFFRNLGPMKFSTIHSFKGWEAKYVILIVHNSNEERQMDASFDESYYVGITRAKDELLVIDTNSKYSQFFSRIPDDVIMLSKKSVLR